MRKQREVSPEAEVKIRSQFDFIDNNLKKDFADPPKRREQCTKYGTGEESIRRGIQGDFTGQI